MMLNMTTMGETSDQPPVLLAHGLFGSGKNLGGLARRLAATRRVVSVDMRNHGDSPQDPDHSYPALARDLAEVIEAQALSTSPISGRTIRDIEFPGGALLGAVQKGERVVKPTGDLRIEEGDIIVIFALAADIPEVERLLQVSIDFF